MKKKYSLSEISTIEIPLKRPKIIFLKGDLGAGKTTLSKHILNNLLGVSEQISSPTYTYYNKYNNHYHFDLYRISDYNEFFAIGGEDILDNNDGVTIIEWPEILEGYYSPDISINLYKTLQSDEREIDIIIHGK